MSSLPNTSVIGSWSRGCDVAIHVYRLLPALNDRGFADRVIANAFTIPERIAAAFNAHQSTHRQDAINKSLEALAVLQTQLYLAAECGMLPAEHLVELCHDADTLTRQLLACRSP
ncbi:MAG: four helix bundle protein [Gammaproteobacteria bacterium]|nr:four helix bundle protein [Gammaproteobacteria bacterium]